MYMCCVTAHNHTKHTHTHTHTYAERFDVGRAHAGCAPPDQPACLCLRIHCSKLGLCCNISGHVWLHHMWITHGLAQRTTTTEVETEVMTRTCRDAMSGTTTLCARGIRWRISSLRSICSLVRISDFSIPSVLFLLLTRFEHAWTCLPPAMLILTTPTPHTIVTPRIII